MATRLATSEAWQTDHIQHRSLARLKPAVTTEILAS
jgi:hypothetical protein